MAEVDRNAAALGVPRAKLMESSGNALARVVRDHCEPGASVRMVCGRGNNAGDAFVAARFLADYDVRVDLLGRPATIRTEIARDNWDALDATDAATRVVRDSATLDLDGDDSPDLFVDAMVGTGVTGALREPAATAARAISTADAPVVAVDVPSGVDADTGTTTADGAADRDRVVAGDLPAAQSAFVVASEVVTFHDATPGLVELADRGAFELTVADIGMPAAAERHVGPGDLRPLARQSDSHKGDHGAVLVVGGGPYTGAPALAGQAAIRAGADLVRVAVPASVAPIVQGFDESLIVRALDGDRVDSDHLPRLRELAAEADTVVVGPGMGSDEATLTAVESLLAEYDGTAVVDAEALSAVPPETDARLLCTPHRGEFAAMGGDPSGDAETRAEQVAAFAREMGSEATLLVKGPTDVISDGDTTRLARTGNPGMTVGGTGDVLAGVTGALAARLSPTRAAAVAAWATGRAGDAAADRHGDGLAATDLLATLPDALRDTEEEA